MKSSPSAEFRSLTLALEGWFDKPLADLPDAVKARVEDEFSLRPWDDMTPDQRRTGALQRDYQHDPITEVDRKNGWDSYLREDALKREVEKWNAASAPTAGDLALKESRLRELRLQQKQMEQQKHRGRADYYPGPKVPQEATVRLGAETSTQPYLAYPKAMSQWAQRLNATADEVAAWIWQGPNSGGIAAYVNANELDPPPRFAFPIGGDDFEYVPFLMACWFSKEDVQQFAPAERYITGQALIERWSNRPDLHAAAYIQAKIAESRLMDTHPIFGLTQGSWPGDLNFPPMTSALFALSQVKKIEAEDLVDDVIPPSQNASSTPETPANANPPAEDASSSTRETPDDSAASTVRRTARKPKTEALYKRWRRAYRKSKASNPGKSDVWHSRQIAKLDVAEGRDAETIRKNMTS